MNKWMLVKVLCTDGIIRIGMLQEGIFSDIDETYAVHGLHGLHEEYAVAMLPYVAEMIQLPQFSNDEEYDEEEFLK